MVIRTARECLLNGVFGPAILVLGLDSGVVGALFQLLESVLDDKTVVGSRLLYFGRVPNVVPVVSLETLQIESGILIVNGK